MVIVLQLITTYQAPKLKYMVIVLQPIKHQN